LRPQPQADLSEKTQLFNLDEGRSERQFPAALEPES
jgi:hypothetical protein